MNRTRTRQPRLRPAQVGAASRLGTRALAALLAAAASGLLGASGCHSGDRDAIPVTVSLQRETPNLAKATVLVDYSRAGAKLAQQDGQPSCAFILPGLSGEFADDGQGALIIRLQSRRGLRGPADIAACRMLAAKPDAEPGDIIERLDVKLTEAEDSAGKVIDLTAAPVTAAAPAGAAGPARAPLKSLADARKAAAAGRTGSAATERAPAVTTGGGAKAATAAAAATPAPSAPPAAPPAPSAPPVPPAGRGAVLAPSAGQQGAAASGAGAAVPGPGTSKDPGYDDSPSDQPKTAQYDVTVNVMGTSPALGALQFEVSHTGSSGGWVGREGDVECEALVDALRASNYVGGRTVRVGLVSIQGMPTPGPMIRCGFRTPEYVSTSSFAVQVVDASDTDSAPISPLPSMRVSSVVRR